MSWEIEDEKTRADAVEPTFDGSKVEDVVFLALRGPDAGKRFLVKAPGGVIGREADAAIQVSDVNVSRRHALIEIGKDGVMITDVESKNGVYVNGVQVARAELFDGVQVQISTDTVLRVRFQTPAETLLFEQLAMSVTRDELTGLPNRRYISERLAQELSFGRRHRLPISIALIDIDDFRKVNDADGREGADRVMQEVAKVVRSTTRLEDVVARYAGDELLVILKGCDADAATTYAERVLAAVRGRTYDTGDVPIRVTVTIGLATYAGGSQGKQPFEPEAVARLLDRADAAMYRGKSAGKDRVQPWTDQV